MATKSANLYARIKPDVKEQAENALRGIFEYIAFDPYTHGYYKVSGRVGDAFKGGMKLK